MACNGKISVVEILFYIFCGYNYIYPIQIVYSIFFDELARDFGLSSYLILIYITLLLGCAGALIRNEPMLILHIFGSCAFFIFMAYILMKDAPPLSVLDRDEFIMYVFTPFAMLFQIVLGVLVLVEVGEYNKKLKEGFKMADVELCREVFHVEGKPLKRSY